MFSKYNFFNVKLSDTFGNSNLNTNLGYSLSSLLKGFGIEKRFFFFFFNKCIEKRGKILSCLENPLKTPTLKEGPSFAFIKKVRNAIRFLSI